MRPRGRQVLLIASMLWLSWLLMMLVHEGGHVLGAAMTGGVVRQVVWHPAVLSRTEVSPNPNPLVEVLAGPVIGSLFPLAIAWIASAGRLRIVYLIWMVAGFCLIANGAYIGVGAIDPVGDARELVRLGVPRWTMGLSGLTAVAGGFWIWHRISGRLGFGRSPLPADERHAWIAAGAAVAVTLTGFLFGDAGI